MNLTLHGSLTKKMAILIISDLTANHTTIINRKRFSAHTQKFPKSHVNELYEWHLVHISPAYITLSNLIIDQVRPSPVNQKTIRTTKNKKHK